MESERIYHLITFSAAITYRGMTFSAVNARTNGDVEGEAAGFVFRPVRIIPAVEATEDTPAQPQRIEEMGAEFFCASAEPDMENAAAVIEAFCAAPEPTPAPVIVRSPLEILSRMTQEEEAALASSSILAVVIVRNRLIAASEVRSDDPRTAEGKAILITYGILTAERAAEIFS